MVIAIVPAAGSGNRMQASRNKLFLPLENEPIIAHTLKKLVGFGISHFIIPIQVVERDQFQIIVDEEYDDRRCNLYEKRRHTYACHRPYYFFV